MLQNIQNLHRRELRGKTTQLLRWYLKLIFSKIDGLIDAEFNSFSGKHRGLFLKSGPLRERYFPLTVYNTVPGQIMC